jgi:hypothetical protein
VLRLLQYSLQKSKEPRAISVLARRLFEGNIFIFVPAKNAVIKDVSFISMN